MILAPAVQEKNIKNAADHKTLILKGCEKMLELEELRLSLRNLEEGIKELGDSL